MAKSSLLESGEIVPVFYPAGNFPNDQRPKFVRAPFVLLRLNGQEYVMPVSGPGDARDLQNLLSTSNFEVEQVLARQDFGFESDDELVVGEHELGDFNSTNKNNWKGCFRIGLI